jgi:hypothetical protein
MTVVRGIATARHFRHVPTHNFFPKMFLLMKNDKQRITYFNCLFYVYCTDDKLPQVER